MPFFKKKAGVEKIEELVNAVGETYNKYVYGEIDDSQLRNLLKRPVKELNKIL
jgi:DNA polymerase III delta prime subunit